MKQDPITSADVAFESDHSYIHEGIGFVVPIVISSLAAGSDYKVCFTTPTDGMDTKVIHSRPLILSATANGIRYQIYEGVTFTGGTPVAPLNMNRRRRTDKSPSFLVYDNATCMLTGEIVVNAVAGGNFANQPAGDGVEVISDNVADVGQVVTIYGTKTGATTTVTSESVTLNGTTQVATTTTTWQNILGVELSAACAGTITIREASGNATITTIAASNLSAGVATPSSTNARDVIVRHDASGASTAPVGIIGTSIYNAALSSVDALNGTTEENHNTDIFRTVTKVLIGAVASTVNVSILYPNKMIATTSTGTAGGAPARSGGSGNPSTREFILESNTSYCMYFKNIGSTTATDIDIDFFFYEEGY